MTLSLQIFRTTFKATGVNAYGSEVGTIEVSVGEAYETVPCVHAHGEFNVAGFVGRYATSAKPWQAMVSIREDAKDNSHLYVSFGRDDRSGRFNKRNAISFEPATFPTSANPKYWEAV